jgi:hypothetical protein
MHGFDRGPSSFEDGEAFKQLLLIVEQLQIRSRARSRFRTS